MPNLTSYHPPVIHLNRELPKSYCDLIQHEFNYNHFLHTRIANIQSSLALTNKKTVVNNIQQDRYFGRSLSDVDQRNLKLCKRILQIWNGERNVAVDCHNEKQRNISHFRLRQKRWKEKIERENKQFIHSLIYRRKKYRPISDRSVAQKAYEQNLKLLETMSQYSKYNLTNPVCKNLLKFNKQKPQMNESKQYSDRSNLYIENILQQTINDAIHIYNQPVPSAPNRIKSSYSEHSRWANPYRHQPQKLVRSISCRQLLGSWRNTKQQKGSLENDTVNEKKSRFFN